MKIAPHAIHRLYEYRKAISSRPYNARGKKLSRCNSCLLAQKFCTCKYKKQLHSNAAFLLLMYDDEVLKPSNSGRLIADLIPDTSAFIWSRQFPHRKLLAAINDPHYQPYLVFPKNYAKPEQQVIEQLDSHIKSGLPFDCNKPPLFIIIDGSWREAIKIFRKSPYLHQLPLLSFTPEHSAKYALRKGAKEFQLGTAEVAALVLEIYGEHENSLILSSWFQLFIESSLFSRSRKSPHDTAPIDKALAQYLELIQ